MWSIVMKTDDGEHVGRASSYFDAFRNYEKQAKKVNAVNREGRYLHPHVHIALRKV